LFSYTLEDEMSRFIREISTFFHYCFFGGEKNCRTLRYF
jgi:hypothetical protein